jgi:hypothetical protein
VITGRGAWSTFVKLDGQALSQFKKLPGELLGKVPLSYFLGTLGAWVVVRYEMWVIW